MFQELGLSLLCPILFLPDLIARAAVCSPLNAHLPGTRIEFIDTSKRILDAVCVTIEYVEWRVTELRSNVYLLTLPWSCNRLQTFHQTL